MKLQELAGARGHPERALLRLPIGDASDGASEGRCVGSASEPGGERVGARRRRARSPRSSRRRPTGSWRWPGSSPTTGRRRRTWSRRRSSGSPATPAGSATPTRPRRTSARSSSTSPATTTAAAWSRCATGRRPCSTSPRPRRRPSSRSLVVRWWWRCAHYRTGNASAWPCATTSSSPWTTSPTPSGCRANSVKTHLQARAARPRRRPGAQDEGAHMREHDHG